jgi:hypothetical protein
LEGKIGLRLISHSKSTSSPKAYYGVSATLRRLQS